MGTFHPTAVIFLYLVCLFVCMYVWIVSTFLFWDFVLCAFCCIYVLDVRCRSLLLCFGTFCYVPSICVRYKTLYIIGGQHDGLCLFWQPARSIFTVLLCHVCFFRANKGSSLGWAWCTKSKLFDICKGAFLRTGYFTCNTTNVARAH